MSRTVNSVGLNAIDWPARCRHGLKPIPLMANPSSGTGRRETLETLEEFKTTLYRFAGNHKAVARWAFVRRDGVQFLLRGVIRVNPREVPKAKSERDYGSILLSEDIIGVDEVEKLATYLLEGDTHGAFGFKLDSGYDLRPLPTRWPSDWPAPIGQPERLADWPHSGFIFMCKTGSQPSIAGPLARVDLPAII